MCEVVCVYKGYKSEVSLQIVNPGQLRILASEFSLIQQFNRNLVVLNSKIQNLCMSTSHAFDIPKSIVPGILQPMHWLKH